MPAVALDQFDAIFGTRRGGTASEQTGLCEQLFCQATLPAGLILVLGASGGGKSVICTLLAAEAAGKGTHVLYLDSDRACGELLMAQENEIVSHSPDLGRGLEAAERLSQAHLATGDSALFLDSLETSLAKYEASDYQDALERLREMAQRLRCPIIATSKNLHVIESLGTESTILKVAAENGDASSVITVQATAGRGCGLLFDFASKRAKVL